GVKEIKRLSALKVVDSASDNKFEPEKPITRREFVRWLVKANNAFRPSDLMVRPADAGTKPAFSDVPNSDPDFKYIEGMNDAGWSIGFKDGTFRPDAQLTREQMISIKTPLDKPFKPTGDLGFTMKWTDYEKISKDFYEVMCWESYSYGNWKRLYGT